MLAVGGGVGVTTGVSLFGVSSGGGDFRSSLVGEAEPLVRVGVRVRSVVVRVGVSVEPPLSSPPQANAIDARPRAANINRREPRGIIADSLAGGVQTK